MNKPLLLTSMLSVSLASTAFAATNTVSQQTINTIQQLAAKPKLVQALDKVNVQRQAQGRKALSASKKQWQQEYPQKQGELITATMQSPLAVWLKAQVKDSNGQYLGALVLDQQGNNVAQTYLTKNYSQSGRVIWRKVSKDASTTYVSRARTDKQFGQRLSTVSVPVVGADKKVIGALAMKVAVKS